MKFYLTILGASGPTAAVEHHSSAQVLAVDNDLYLIDCCDDALRQMRRFNISLMRLKAIFISHMHPDHVLGLPALLMALGLSKRTEPIDVYGNAPLEAWIKSFLKYFHSLTYYVNFHTLEGNEPYPIHVNKQITVTAFPLKHGIPCWGFLFKENKRSLEVMPDKIALYHIPPSAIAGIKLGGDYRQADGSVIFNRRLVKPPLIPRSYAYCSDTTCQPYIAELLRGVNLIYHEATFADEDKRLASLANHSTSCDAARIARMAEAEKLIIGHISSRYKEPLRLLEEAQKIFPNTDLAVEGKIIGIPHKNWELQDEWDVYENLFIPGSVHQGTICALTDLGALVILPHGVTGSITTAHMMKRDGQTAGLNETLPFKVAVFNKATKTILLSHRRTFALPKKCSIDDSSFTGIYLDDDMDEIDSLTETENNAETDTDIPDDTADMLETIGNDLEELGDQLENMESEPYDESNGVNVPAVPTVPTANAGTEPAADRPVEPQESSGTAADQPEKKETDPEKLLREQRAKIISTLSKGQVVEGKVRQFGPFGVMVDLGGVMGFVDKANVAWEWIRRMEDVLYIGQTVKLLVLDIDKGRQEIALGLKQLSDNPWESAAFDMKEGDVVTGTVTSIAGYGAIVEVAHGIQGLLHASELSWSQELPNVRKVLKEGDRIDVRITSLIPAEQKLLLSIRQLTPDPWETIETAFPTGSRHKARICNRDNYDLMLELAPGVNGRMHVSDLSWTRKYRTPVKLCMIDESIEVVVLEINRLSRCLYLGHKQIANSPWNELEKIFTIGSVHEGSIVEFDGEGALVALHPFEVEALSTRRHLVKTDGTLAQMNERLDFKVTAFDKEKECIQVVLNRLDDDGEAAAEFPSETDTADIAAFARDYIAAIEKSKAQSERNKQRREQRAESEHVLVDLHGSLKKNTMGDLIDWTAVKDRIEKSGTPSKKGNMGDLIDWTAIREKMAGKGASSKTTRITKRN